MFLIKSNNPGRQRRCVFHMLVVNLAVCNLVPAVTLFQMVVASSFKGAWLFGSAGCYVYSIGVGTCGLASVGTMALISLDNYSTIITTLTARALLTRARALVAILATWLYGFLWTAPPLVGYGEYVLDGFGTSCTFNYYAPDAFTRSFVVALFLGGFCVPLAVNVACYSRLYMHVRDHRRDIERQFTDRFRVHSNRSSVQAEIKISLFSVAVVTVFCVAWLPYAITGLLAAAGFGHLITPSATFVCAVFAKVTSIFSPFVYITLKKSRLSSTAEQSKVKERNFSLVSLEDIRRIREKKGRAQSL